MTRLRPILWSLLAAVLLACATTPGSAPSAASGPITAEEIASANVPTALEAVNRLRAAWLRDRSGGAEQAPLVFFDEQRQLSGVSALRDVRAREVVEIRFVRGADAVTRWGLEGRGGAIIVVLR